MILKHDIVEELKKYYDYGINEAINHSTGGLLYHMISRIHSLSGHNSLGER